MPLYAILCHFMPVYAILCHFMPFYAILCHFMPFYAILCHFMPFYAILCYFMPFYAILCHFMPLYAILCQYWYKFLRSRPWIGLILGQILSILAIRLYQYWHTFQQKKFFFRLQLELNTVKNCHIFTNIGTDSSQFDLCDANIGINCAKLRIWSRTQSYWTFYANIGLEFWYRFHQPDLVSLL